MIILARISGVVEGNIRSMSNIYIWGKGNQIFKVWGVGWKAGDEKEKFSHERDQEYISLNSSAHEFS